MEVSFYLKDSKSTKETAIWARISYFGYKLKYYPSIKILPKYWNKETQLIRQSFTGYADFNRRLKDIARDAELSLIEYQNENQAKLAP